MKKLNSLNLQTRILLGFAMSFVAFSLIGLYNVVILQYTTQSATDVFERYVPFESALRQFQADDLELLASTVEVALLQFSEADDAQIADEVEQLSQARADAAASLELVARYSAQFFPELQTAIEEVEARQTEFLDLGERLIAAAENAADPEGFEEAKEAYESAERSVLVAIDNIVAAQASRFDEINAAFNTTSVTAFIIVISGLVVGLVVSAIGAVLGARTITRPLVELKDIANDIAQGDYSRRAPDQSQDEVGSLGQSINLMSQAVEQREKQLSQQIEEVRKSRDEAERANQVKSAFLASMSHELRTPLNAVINFTRFVVDGDTGPVNEQQAELLNDVIGSAKHLLNLINDVLDMSKIEAGSLNLFLEDNVSVDALIKQAVTTGQGLLGDKSVRLETEIAPDLPPMRADRQRVLQILLNIISNACKFTEQGAIKVRAAHRDNHVTLSVEDTGPGIAPEDQPLVFEPFKQTEAGLRQHGGTGLGMPIARSLAEAHGGRLWLESAPGKGSTFYVELPVQAADVAPALA